MNLFKKTANRFKSYSKLKKIIISTVAIFLAVVTVALAVLFIVFKYDYNSMRGYTDSDLGVTDTNLPKGVTNIALFGVDSRKQGKFTGNTDSIMVLSVDTIHKKIKIISIMRDSLVKIEGYSPYKINSAYAKGGPALAINTLNKNFGLNITEYATINFSGMSKIIDAVGGVEVTLTKAEVKDANIHIKYMASEQKVKATYIQNSGTQILNGLQAVSFTRIRHVATIDGINDDYGRTDRQRHVMQQLFNSAVQLPNIKLTKLVKTCLPFVETSLSYLEIINLAGALRIEGIQYSQMRVPQADYVINGGFNVRGGSTVYYNLDYAAKVFHAFIYDDMSFEQYKEKFGVDKSGWYNASLYKDSKKIADESSEAELQKEIESYYDMVESEYDKNNPDTDKTSTTPEDITASTGSSSGSSSFAGTSSGGTPSGSTSTVGTSSVGASSKVTTSSISSVTASH